MNLIGVQFNIVWEDKQTNFERVRSLLSTTSIEPGSLILLPEMFAIGFSMNVLTIGADEPSLTHGFLQSLSREHQSYVLGGLVTHAPNGKGRNQATLCSPMGEVLNTYTKLHPFSYAGETDYYEPGDRVLTFPWHDFTAAPFICYDLRFPEAFRHAAQKGANLLLVIANWPQTREEHWLALLRARAIENQAYVAGINRCGSDPKHSYSGRSQIIDPRGNILADAGNKECVIQAEADFNAVQEYRHQFPALVDIRKEYRME